MDLPTKLQHLADAREWNQSDVARKLGLRPSTVQNWFSGRSTPGSRQILGIARLFDVPMEFLVDDQLDRVPVAEPEGLTEDERVILRMARSLGAEKAILRLMEPPAVETRGLLNRDRL